MSNKYNNYFQIDLMHIILNVPVIYFSINGQMKFEDSKQKMCFTVTIFFFSKSRIRRSFTMDTSFALRYEYGHRAKLKSRVYCFFNIRKLNFFLTKQYIVRMSIENKSVRFFLFDNYL